MILVLLGTFVTPFERPLIEIEKLCEAGTITEEVIVQSGHTNMTSQYMVMRPFIDPNELTELCGSARIVISHAGAASLIGAIQLGKKVITIARLSKYGEHVDDHQLEILEKFATLNYILPWRENVALDSLLNEIDDFTPTAFVSNKPMIMNYLTDYIDSL